MDITTEDNSVLNQMMPQNIINLEVDGLKDLVRCVQLQEEHDEDPMVGHLMFFIISAKTDVICPCHNHKQKTCWNSVPRTS